jgi:hypothetical protein
MSANNVLRITDLNFDSIKENLKSFLSSQNQFTDYDFESSTLSIILDLLAYNTYYNAMYLHFVGNEMFLDTAQLRNSVVSRAKMLGYTPRSARGVTASLDVVVTPNDSPLAITVAANTRFSTSIDGISYNFVTPESYSLEAQSNGAFTGTISIVEGEPLQHRYTVSTSTPVSYLLANPNADTSSVVVRIQESSSNTSIETYNKVTDISAANSTSKIYYLQETLDNNYEVYFGDNIFGKKPRDGNIVILDYRVVNGSLVNGANTFSAPSTLDGYSTFTITTNSRAQGGANQESISSVKFNAPMKFQAQDRLVTARDYKTAILEENGDIQSLSVWGGEENNPPIYGKVFVCAKPRSGAIISTQRKELIKSQLKQRNVLAIDIEFVDATYLYIVPTIKVRYNPDLTSLSAAALNTKIQSALITFEDSTLGVFENRFYLSKLVAAVTAADPSFVSADIDIQLQKRFVPVTNSQSRYSINFNNAIKRPETSVHSSHEGSHNLSSSRFTYGNYSNAKFDEDGEGVLRIFNQPLGSKQIYVKPNAGTVDYDTGLVVVNNLLITEYNGNYVSINMSPVEKNIFGVRNQIILITDAIIQTINDNTNSVTSAVASVATQGVTTTNITENGINTVIV